MFDLLGGMVLSLLGEMWTISEPGDIGMTVEKGDS